MPYGKRRIYSRRKSTKKSFSKRRYNRKSSSIAYRALRIAKSANRRVAGEVCKFESVPSMFSNINFTGSGTTLTRTVNNPLNTITSGQPWIMPLNWIYTSANIDSGTTSGGSSGYTINGQEISFNGMIALQPQNVSLRNPIWYNTLGSTTDLIARNSDLGTELQYRLKYLYINALFNAAEGNPDGALRIVIVKDKQATGGAATWYDTSNSENSRGVFNSQRIDAQLNPNTVGRFKIMYDKTLRFTTINSYKPFKYFKRISTSVRNNRNIVSTSTLSQDDGTGNAGGYLQTNDQSPPVQKNAFYLMIYSDGLNFNYTDDTTTGNGTFHLFNRVAYYNN